MREHLSVFILMLLRTGIQGINFLLLVYLLPTTDVGWIATFTSLAITLSTFTSLGANYVIMQEVIVFKSDLTSVSTLFFSAQVYLSSAAIFIILILLRVGDLDNHLIAIAALVFIYEGLFSKAIELQSIINQVAGKTVKSQYLLLNMAAARLFLTTLMYSTGYRDALSYCFGFAVLLFVYFIYVINSSNPKIAFLSPQETLRAAKRLKVSRITVFNQSISNGVLVFVGDGIKPVITFFAGPSATAGLAISQKLIEVALLPAKTLLFNRLRSWFESKGDINAIVKSLGLKNAVFSLGIGITSYFFGLFIVDMLYQSKYPGFAHFWWPLAFVIPLKGVALAVGDYLVSTGFPLRRTLGLLCSPIVASLIFGTNMSLDLATVILASESAAFIVLLFFAIAASRQSAPSSK